MFGFIKRFRVQVKLYYGARKCKDGKFEKSLKCFDDAFKIDSNCVLAIEFKGALFEKFEKYDEALEFYELSTKMDPAESRGWVGKGNLLFKLGSYEEAIQWYDKAFEITNNLYFIFRKSEIYENCEEYDKELESINFILDIQADNDKALYTKGRILVLQRRYKESFDCYCKLADLYPDNEMGWVGMAKISRYMKNYKDNIKYIKEAIELNNKESDYFYIYSNCLERLGEYEDALTMIDKSLDLFPKEDVGYGITKNLYIKGRILTGLNKIDEAEENFNLALDNALESVQWCLDNDFGEDARDYCYIAIILECLNKANEAIEYYEKALKLDPECLRVKNSLELLKS